MTVTTIDPKTAFVVLVNATGGAPGRVSQVRAGGAGRPADAADLIALL